MKCLNIRVKLLQLYNSSMTKVNFQGRFQIQFVFYYGNINHESLLEKSFIIKFI